MKNPTLLPSSTDNTAKYELIPGTDAILVIDQASKPVYTNPTISISLPRHFTGEQAIDMFLLIMKIQETMLDKMISRIGKTPK